MSIRPIIILALCLPSLSAQAAVIHGEKGADTTFDLAQTIETEFLNHQSEQEIAYGDDGLLSDPTLSDPAIAISDANSDQLDGKRFFAIPEPAAALLGVLGFLTILRRRRR